MVMDCIASARDSVDDLRVSSYNSFSVTGLFFLENVSWPRKEHHIRFELVFWSPGEQLV